MGAHPNHLPNGMVLYAVNFGVFHVLRHLHQHLTRCFEPYISPSDPFVQLSQCWLEGTTSVVLKNVKDISTYKSSASFCLKVLKTYENPQMGGNATAPWKIKMSPESQWHVFLHFLLTYELI